MELETHPTPLPTPAAHAVLNTAELLDMILSPLSLRDLLSAQKVSYRWQRVIACSARAQKTQYLAADHSTALYTDARTNWTTPTPQTNPLFQQRFVQRAAQHALQSLNAACSGGADAAAREPAATAFAHPAASWRAMLLFQPPVAKAWLRPVSARFEDPPRLLVAREGEVGLRMADVVGAFEALLSADDSGYYAHLLGCTVARKVVWMLTPV